MKGRHTLPGFRFDSKRRLARFEVVLPGTDSRKRRRTTVPARDIAEATAKYHAFRADVLAGRRVNPWTFREYVAKYGEKLQARLSDSARRREAQFLEHQLLPFLGDAELHRINAPLVHDLIVKLKADEYHPTTINNVFGTLRKYLRDAVQRGELAEYPIREGAKQFRQKEPELRLELTPDERTAFLKTFEDEAGFRTFIAHRRAQARVARIEERRAQGRPTTGLHGGGSIPEGDWVGEHFARFRASKPLFLASVSSGLSRTDLLGLQWRDVDLVNGWIRIERKKTGRLSRIKFSQELLWALEECKKRRVVGRDFVFLDESGKPYPLVKVIRYFEIAKGVAGITRRLRIHDLRHTFGSTHASAGTSLQAIREMMGHADIKTTLRYAKTSEQAIETAVRHLDEVLANSAANSSPLSLAATGTEGHADVVAAEGVSNGGPDRDRTCDKRFRKPLLYPTELRALGRILAASVRERALEVRARVLVVGLQAQRLAEVLDRLCLLPLPHEGRAEAVVREMVPGGPEAQRLPVRRDRFVHAAGAGIRFREVDQGGGVRGIDAEGRAEQGGRVVIPAPPLLDQRKVEERRDLVRLEAVRRFEMRGGLGITAVLHEPDPVVRMADEAVRVLHEGRAPERLLVAVDPALVEGQHPEQRDDGHGERGGGAP